MTEPSVDPGAAARAAADTLARLTGASRHDVVVVLGSGWAPAADALGETVAEFPITDLPGFPAPSAVGHAGRVRSIEVNGQRILAFLGRVHLYEGHGVEAVVHGIRTAAAAGCRTAILTNGCGGLNPDWSPGTPVLIRDHINLTSETPLRGATFIDLTDLYSSRLRDVARAIDPALPDGVYVQFRGPQYETPAEIGMVRVIGGSLVGMSTALEAIAAREAGMDILGLSLVTNLAAGMTGQPLSHAEVLEAGRAAAERMGDLLAEVLRRL